MSEYKIKREKVSKNSKDILKDVINSEKSSGSKGKKAPEKREFNGKKLKHGTLSVIFTVVFTAVLVLINVVATTLFDKYPITVDLTKDKIYSASKESEDYVKKVKDKVLVTVFASEDDFSGFSEYNKQAVELLKNYCKINSNLSYRFVDIDSNPEIARNYDSVKAFDIVFEIKGEAKGNEVKRVRNVSMVDLVNFKDEFVEQVTNTGATVDTLAQQYSQQYGDDRSFLYAYKDNIESSNADQAFVSALMAITDPDPQTVTVLTGRNELTQVAYFQQVLKANGYNVNSVDITSENIPDDTSIVLIPAPKNDYMDEEIDKLDKFLDNAGKLGKQMIYIASFSQDKTPKLDEFLAEYGIKVGEGAVCESDKTNYYGYPYVTTTGEISDNFKESLQTKEPKIITALCRPVSTLFDTKDMTSAVKYVQSSKNAYSAKINVAATGLDIGDHLSEGQQGYMAVGTRAAFGEGDDDNTYSNVIVFGSEYMVSDQYLADSHYQNSEYFLSVINGLTHKTQGVTIKPKTVTATLFDINDMQKNVLKWTFCLILPAAVLVLGIVIWVRRKNK